ncbi:MAG: outer membrane protein assembly factor BamA [Terrimicrobiaceae bacterium]
MKKALRVFFFIFIGLCATGAAAKEWVFEGNTLFSDARLLQALARFDASPAAGDDITVADDAAFFLREFYFNQGFRDAEVTYDFSPQRVVFSIDEGDRLWIGRISFQGGEEISRDRLRDIFSTAIRQATRAAFGRLRFVATAVEDAGEKIRQAYVNEGFLDATVEVVEQPAADFRSTDLTVVIETGIRYRIGQVRVEGLDLKESSALLKELRGFSERPFRPSDRILSQSRALDFLRARGYFFAAVEVAVEPADGEGIVDLVVRATPGRKMRIGKISAPGTVQTRERSLLGRFGIRPGSVYNAGALDAAERRLWFTGAFSTVNVKTKPAGGDTVDIKIDVRETESRSLSATVGYSEWYLAFANATFTDRNFLGSLNRLRLSGYISQKSFGGEAEFSDPWLLGSDLTGSLEAFAMRRELPAFQATQFGTRLGLSQRKDEHSGTGWRVVYEWKSVTNAKIYSGDEPDTREDYRLGQLTLHQQLDRRNDPLAPMSGYNLRYDAGLAAPPLLGDLTFFKASAQATWYVPLRKIVPERPFVPFFTFNHSAGVILPLGDTDSIPVPERFFLGGPDSVRSFQFDGMAPRNREAIPLGGLAFFQANIELQWPVGRGFFIAAFTDAGNLAPSLEEMDLDQTRIAPGAGIRFYTPLGALRMDYAWNMIQRDGDPFGAWHFGLGITF